MRDAQRISALLSDLDRRSGWRVRRVGETGGKHHTIYPPNGGAIISVPRTPSDNRWRLNLRAQLRRSGWVGSILD